MAVGVVVGLGVALVGSRAVASMLFNVNPVDAVTFILAPSILTLVAILARWIPAHRAARVDPMVALRDE